jgi:hypothetical protein
MRAALLALVLAACGNPSQNCTLVDVGRWNGSGSPIGNYSDTTIYFTFAGDGTVKYEFGSAEATLSYTFAKNELTLSDDRFCRASGFDELGTYKITFDDCKQFGMMVASDPCKMRSNVFNGTVLVRP